MKQAKDTVGLIALVPSYWWASLVAQTVKNLPAMWETWVRSLGWEDPLEKEKATHSSILAMGLQRVRHDRRLIQIHL